MIIYIFFLNLSLSLSKLLKVGFGSSSSSYRMVLHFSSMENKRLFDINLQQDFLFSNNPFFASDNSKTLVHYSKGEICIDNKYYQKAEIVPATHLGETFFVDAENSDEPIMIDLLDFYYVEENETNIDDSVGLSFKNNDNKEFSFLYQIQKKLDLNKLFFGFSPLRESTLYIGDDEEEIDTTGYDNKMTCKVKEDRWGCDLNKIELSSGYEYYVRDYSIFQTNTPIIYVPADFMIFLNRTYFAPLIEKKECKLEWYSTLKKFSCFGQAINDFPDFTFVFGNKGIKIPGKKLFHNFLDDFTLMIQGGNVANKTFLFGSTLYKDMFTIFDQTSGEVKFYSVDPFEVFKDNSKPDKPDNNKEEKKEKLQVLKNYFKYALFVLIIGLIATSYAKLSPNKSLGNIA